MDRGLYLFRCGQGHQNSAFLPNLILCFFLFKPARTALSSPTLDVDAFSDWEGVNVEPYAPRPGVVAGAGL